ncbi:MAG: prephenate dehydrogenase [Sulfurovum sp. PC08-66]|jgi:prephenate dehydrogenase|nr:MAG: prephenate dehydrogenase [Sulfurovum sp. PC08-66]
MNQKRVAIIGLGLMGGSLGLAIKKASNNYYIIGFDHNKTHQKEALEHGLVDECSDDNERITQCDIIILAIPVDAIVQTINAFESVAPHTTIIDLGSTKHKISTSIKASLRTHFVAAHPMAGTEKCGPSAAFDTLYNDKVLVLCDIDKSGEYQVQVAREIFTLINMKIVEMDSYQHDIHAAYISHMPHALSYALANAVLNQEDPKSILTLAGGGFRDMSRIAKSSPTMWEDIFRQNKENVLSSIQCLNKELHKCEALIQEEDWNGLNSWMAKANALHQIL